VCLSMRFSSRWILGPFRRLAVATTLICFANFSLTAPANAISLIRDAEIEALIKEYTDPVLIAAGLEPSEITIYLVNDPTLNAFAGGKNIFIHTGLMVEAERPMELIGVIAHEIGHVAGRHTARASQGSRRATMPMLLGLGIGLIAALAGAPDVGMAVIAGGQQIGMMEYLAYSREQESRTDQAAVTYLNKAGISSDGMLSFFEKFRYAEVFSTRSQNIPPFWRTHPMSSDRISALSNRVLDSPYRGQPDSDESTRRFELIRGKLQGFIDRPYVTLRNFPLEDTSQKARYARAIAYFRTVDIDEALAEVDAMLEVEPDNPYFLELRGQILFESGRVAESVVYHQRSVELAPNEPLLRVNLATSMISLPDSEDDMANNVKAREQLQLAIKDDPENTFAYHQLAITYAREGNEGMAALSTAERYYYSGDIGGAASFANRAMHKIEKGTPAWHRASDILNVAKNSPQSRGH
jgi:predicted Zn-dependent protease